MCVKKHIVAVLLVGLCLWGGTSRAQDDETALFTTTTAPDALIILDLSYSMEGNPADGTNLTNIWGNSSCTAPFYSSSGSGHATNCKRINIAKRVIFDILDDNSDGTINGSDETSLGVRLGYMRFKGCDTGANYLSGNNQLIKPINTKYSTIFCGKTSSCSITNTCTGTDPPCINGATTAPGTPLADALNESKLYLDVHKAADTCKGCRQKFVILVTDGVDTCACGGSGTTEQPSDMYKRRRASVAKAKALADAGYKLFVISFGASMPDYVKNSMNWMAYYGGTDNPLTANSGSTSGYNIATGCEITDMATNAKKDPAVCCDVTETSCYPSGVTSCLVSPTTAPIGTAPCDGFHLDCYAATDDPGTAPLSGYAFLAADGDELSRQLKAAIGIIREATFSFSQASVQSNRTADENFIYVGSFEPKPDPFWHGHMKRYSIAADGSVPETYDWDAGTVLQGAAAGGRNIKAYCTGALRDFKTATSATDLTLASFGATTLTERDAVINYIRGGDNYDSVNWKFGDIFRSTPITVGTPSEYFSDARDTSSSSISCTGGAGCSSSTTKTVNAFGKYRCDDCRASANGKRLIMAGSNDGQLHAFNTSNGAEAWSFIPPNLLSRLKLIAHATEPSSLTHQYYVDGPVTVSDAWLGTGAGTSKSAAEWKTLLILGEGRGAGTNLWSSSISCDSGFNQVHSSTYPYYCGYYCLDVTDTQNPAYKWSIGKNSSGLTATQGPYMGAPWSRAAVGRILDGGNEKWVAFIGGGVSTPGSANSGKGFYVIDLANGDVLWSYTNADKTSLDYPMPAPPTAVDTNNDGFIDTVYIGDLGGNMWRFKHDASWSGDILFDAIGGGGNRPIYTAATVTIDTEYNLWIYWGTGDKTDPTNPSAQERFFGMKDNDRTTMRSLSSLDSVTGGGTPGNHAIGFYMNLPGQGEKMLADPTVFGGIVYFTTYTPTSSDCCSQNGVASLYGIKYTTGGGGLPITGSPSSTVIGTGIPSAPVISLKPGSGGGGGSGSGAADLYITTSGAQVYTPPFNPPGLANRTNLLFWKDKRVEP